MPWVIEYSQEADSDLVDHYPYTNGLDLVLIAVSLTADGIPATGAHQLEPGLLMRKIQQHTVIHAEDPKGRPLYSWLKTKSHYGLKQKSDDSLAQPVLT